VLRRALPAAIDAIAVGGRVVVESYHSLEDRLVKRAFVDATRSDVPEDLPFVPAGHEPAFRLLTRGAEKADPAEVDHNPRAASVRLRALERLTPTPHRGVAPEMTSP
jgi:16S rRNA (cytosine1402-N4)-methyltransferase